MSVQNDNEKLIEEARRAKTAVYLATDASVADDLSRIIGGLADALEASEKAHAPVCEMCRWEQGFGAREPIAHTCEKAHTPTDDEREALIPAAHKEADQRYGATDDWAQGTRDLVRAALRAAAEAGGEGR